MSYDALRTLALIALLFIIRSFFLKYQLSKFRDKLFVLRRELFLIAAENKHNIKFNSQIYLDINSLFNNMIRFAHNVSFTQAIFFYLFNCMAFRRKAKIGNYLFDRIENELKQTSDPERQKALSLLMDRYNREIAYYILNSSIPFVIFVTFKILVDAIKSIIELFLKQKKDINLSILNSIENLIAPRMSKQAEYSVA